MSAIISTIAAIMLSTLVLVTFRRTPIKVIKLDSRWESLLWTWRLRRSKLHFAEKLEDWYYKTNDSDSMLGKIFTIKEFWLFLRPFFASRGYTLYQKHPKPDWVGDIVAAPWPPQAKDASYPYARHIRSNDPDPKWSWSPRVWAARDALGREVVIKVISETDKPTQELRVFQRLNSKRLRADPANNTIYALEYITFDKFVFVVMPRWDSSLFPEFETVSQLMSFALIWLQTFDFLHRNKIVHLDFVMQNTGMNVILQHRELFRRTGLRDPKEVRYALLDFGFSIAFPEDTIIEDVRMIRYNSWFVHYIPDNWVIYPYNPFKADLAMLASSLQLYVRHLEHLIPELGPFFDSVVDLNDPNQLTASQAFARFKEICDGLSPEIASSSFDTWTWRPVILSLPVLYVYHYKRYPRIIKLESKYESLLWTWRLMRSNIIFPEALEDWNLKNLEDSHGDFIYIHSCWMFVLPFFVSRGYAMYQQDPVGLGNLNPPPFPPAAKATSYPYSRQLPSKTPIPRAVWAPRIWAARDALGRDVIIKVISEVDNPSNELKVMQLLNSKRLRSDPANHTIYAIEYITFDKFVFVVMPRWDSAIFPEFANVSELMHFTKIILEAFDFLHRNRIVHLDCLAQNMGMNAVMTTAEIDRRTGVRDPKEVRYALFDFDAAVIFPEDTVIEEARMDHVLSFDRHYIPKESITYPYNPFRVDVAFMGTCLQTYVRHLESKIPELGPFFDSLIDINDPNQPSASQALARFTEISNNLSPEVASASFDGFIWCRGGVVYKKDGDVITITE
uniref:Protein kinase domain-containing protein n=1 Tax=Psilocybe cubensis TaxID=181762 RepID=A0A8H7Y4K3_PSICU